MRNLTNCRRVTTLRPALALVAAALVLLIILIPNLPKPLSAMERVVNKLQQVHSYRYQLFTRDTFTKDGGTQPTTVIHTGTTWWLAPDSYRYDEKLVRTAGPEFPDEAPNGLLAHFTGIHPSGDRGMFIYHGGREDRLKANTYYFIPAIVGNDLGKKSPITRLRMVRQGTGKVLRHMPPKKINGRKAAGYIFALENAEPGSGFDELEVWVDPDTDLPIELGYTVKTPESISEFRITDCQWNVEIDSSMFETTPPPGYTETPAPE